VNNAKNHSKLFKAYVAEIHRCQDFEVFTLWVKANYLRFLPETDEPFKLATLLARSV